MASSFGVKFIETERAGARLDRERERERESERERAEEGGGEREKFF